MIKVALIIGHNEASQGAVNKKSGTTEFMFNEPLAMKVGDLLVEKGGYQVAVVYRDGTYEELPGRVNETEADIAISMHCNAFNKKQNGSETLYYHKSKKGKRLAGLMQYEVVKCLGLHDRGLKPCKAKLRGKAGDRGGYLLKKTNMPCIIVEPFFIDCDKSLKLAQLKLDELATAYVTAIQRNSYTKL